MTDPTRTAAEHRRCGQPVLLLHEQHDKPVRFFVLDAQQHPREVWYCPKCHQMLTPTTIMNVTEDHHAR